MRMLVTGGNGFLGQRLVKRLLTQRHDVCCVVRPASDTPAFRQAVAVENGGHLDVVHGALSRIDAWIDKAGPCDVVIHVAAAMTGGAAALFVNNVVATRQLIAQIPRVGAKRFVLISSLGVYGTAKLKHGDVLDETCPVDPKPYLRDPYSHSKVAEEAVCWQAHEQGKIALVVIRPGVIYGPGRGVLSGRIGLQVGGMMVRMGGRQRLPYTYVENCAAGIVLAATVPGIEGQAFNLIDTDPPTAKSVLKQHRRTVQKVRVIPIPHWAINPLAKACVWYNRKSKGQLPAVLTPYKAMAMWKRLKYSNEKARKQLGWNPDVSFAEGLRISTEVARKELDEERRSKR